MNFLIGLASVLLWASGLTVSSAADPWGHWEGTLTGQFGTLRIELDLSKADDGKPAASLSVPERKLNGLPIFSITIDGHTIAFDLAAIGARFKGDISPDGTELTGLFEASAGSLPVTLTRKGDAHVMSAPRNAAVTKELEGTWNGTLHVDGGKRLLLTLQNQADHSAKATMVSVDEAGLTVPVAVVQSGASLTLNVPSVSSSYVGTLSADGNEVVGTYTTSEGFEFPLTFRRGPIADAKK